MRPYLLIAGLPPRPAPPDFARREAAPTCPNDAARLAASIVAGVTRRTPDDHARLIGAGVDD